MLSQPSKNIIFLYKKKKLSYDIGQNWDSITLFKSLNYEWEILSSEVKSSRGLKTFFNFRKTIFNKYLSLNSISSLNVKNNYGVFLFTELNNNSFLHNVEKKDLFFYSRNNIISGFVFNNSWSNVHFGKGREVWGAGPSLQLALNDNSDIYNYISLSSNYGKIKVKYIHGFLERLNNGNNRYINARGIEYSNNKTVVLGFSETIIYSGINRQFDFGYFNPISSHLEIELNNRLMITNNINSNAVWQFHLDWVINKNKRISFNYLFDEFVLDKDIEIGKEHGRAYSFRMAYSPIFLDKNLLTIYFNTILIGTPTFRHLNGYNNFILNGRPLGWPGGSDLISYTFGVNYLNDKGFISISDLGYLIEGEESIIEMGYDQYLDYNEGVFPSGDTDKNLFLETGFEYYYSKNTIIKLGIKFIDNNKSSLTSILNYTF